MGQKDNILKAEKAADLFLKASRQSVWFQSHQNFQAWDISNIDNERSDFGKTWSRIT